LINGAVASATTDVVMLNNLGQGGFGNVAMQNFLDITAHTGSRRCASPCVSRVGAKHEGREMLLYNTLVEKYDLPVVYLNAEHATLVEPFIWFTTAGNPTVLEMLKGDQAPPPLLVAARKRPDRHDLAGTYYIPTRMLELRVCGGEPGGRGPTKDEVFEREGGRGAAATPRHVGGVAGWWARARFF
jgi:hypothetical protein